jgi:hypothetical protein
MDLEFVLRRCVGQIHLMISNPQSLLCIGQFLGRGGHLR